MLGKLRKVHPAPAATYKSNRPKSNRGRKKVEYDPKDTDRQTMVILVCGETGVGKTYRNIKEIERYMKGDPEKGHKGRKVLIFDVNDDDYPKYKAVNPQHIGALTEIRARRIRPFKKDGKLMTIDEKRAVVDRMVTFYKNGLIVLEDIDKYLAGAKGQTVIGLLTTYRHTGLDIMISHQSLAKITTTEFQNCTWLRIHKQVDDISRYRERIPNYFLVRIATLIVEEQYDLANMRFRSGLISEEEYNRQKSFFVYVDMRKLRIRGCSRAAFMRACKRYLDTEGNGQVKRLMMERDNNDEVIYKTRNEAIVKLIGRYMRYHEDNMQSPIKEAA